ncbi:MAG: putative UBC5-E2 ubiquitin-conjugating enzyme [Piptocephalis tieghemiana]|nr:MAG: putative UBC5-E2 ubiquitin-conjugating enzyme [Piptocephalis tieghemiana]
MAQKRINKELIQLQADPIENMVASPVSDANLYQWEVIYQGNKNGPYKGGTFKLDITFSTDYPFKAPNVRFQTRIYHPNISEDGSICLDILKSESWKPSTKLHDILSSLVNLIENPNPDDPLETLIADQYRNDHPAFLKKAKEMTKKYASA